MSSADILTPFLDDADVILYAGDCVEIMARMPGSSVDAIVTDPPYGLEFMGRAWDGFGTPLGFQNWTEAWALEAFRILKPGGHLLAFAGTRTYHRMASGVEDAGFEIRDCIAWMYGSGFPKSLDVSKAIDKAAGAQRKDVYEDNSGWGTALKPAFEPIVVARRPLIGTVAANVLEHGTGALNIDACRIGSDVIITNGGRFGGNVYGDWAEKVNAPHVGRWPANVALDETAANMLDEQSGERKSVPFKAITTGAQADRQHVSFFDLEYSGRGYTDTGGASRFFYTAKASRQDRNVGGLADNTHPTVKPTDLMRWLIRLVTPPGGIILDPFGGSGSTGLAARAENVRCILIERESEYLQIIRDRLAQQNLFATRDDHE